MTGLFRAWLDFTMAFAVLLIGLGGVSTFFPALEIGVLALAPCFVAPIAYAAFRYGHFEEFAPDAVTRWAAAAVMALSALAISVVVALSVLYARFDPATGETLAVASTETWRWLMILSLPATFALSRLLFPTIVATILGDDASRAIRRVAPVGDARPTRRIERSGDGFFWIWLDFALAHCAVLCGSLAYSLAYPGELPLVATLLLWLGPIVFASQCHAMRSAAPPSASLACWVAASLALTAHLLDGGALIAVADFTVALPTEPNLGWLALDAHWIAVRAGLFWLVFVLRGELMQKTRTV